MTRTDLQTAAHTTAPENGSLTNADWIRQLGGSGPEHDAAVRRLHELMIRGARHQVARKQPGMSGLGEVRVEDIVNQAADEATVAVLAKLATFEGRSRFTTWAFKFAILHTAVEVRRTVWKHREITMDLLPEPPATGASPEQMAEAGDLSAAVRGAIETVLTTHQRAVVLALLVDEVPIDVLADRLGSTRNALYKTLHDARVRLRRHLTATGHLTAPSTPSGVQNP